MATLMATNWGLVADVGKTPAPLALANFHTDIKLSLGKLDRVGFAFTVVASKIDIFEMQA